MSMVPAGQPPDGPSLLARLFQLLLGGPRVAPHESTAWDEDGRCRRARCSDCATSVGVSTAGRMAPHGPHHDPCPGSRGGVTVPVVGPGNAGAAYRAKNQALPGTRRRRGRR